MNISLDSTTQCGVCKTIDGCVCPMPTKPKQSKRRRLATAERYDIVDYLRQGGEQINGVWHGWDSEMASYALSFADMIEAGKHRS